MRKHENVVYRNLLCEMIMRGETYEDLATLCGIKRWAFVKKMNGETVFSVPQANVLCAHFNKTFEHLFKTSNF